MTGKLRLGWAILLIALVGAGIALGVRFALQPTVYVQAVETGTAVRSVQASVQVRARKSLLIRPESGGRLLEVREEGALVAAGETLAQLDARDIDLNIRNVQSQRDSRAATLAVQIRSHDREIKSGEQDLEFKRSDLEIGSISEVALRASQNELEAIRDAFEIQDIQAQREVDELGFTLEQLQNNKDRMTLEAPFAGTVTNLELTAGALVSGGQTIGTLISNDRVVEALVSEENFSGVRVGQPVRVRFLGDEYDIDGIVSKVLPTADTDTQRYVVEVDLSGNVDPARLEKPGITGVALIILDQRQSDRIVPLRAIYNGQIYVVRNGRVEIRQPEVGFQSLEKAEILSGVEPGEMVIVDGQGALRDGDRVKAVDVAGGAAAP